MGTHVGKKVVPGVRVSVGAGFSSNDESAEWLDKGMSGLVVAVDEDGDAQIQFDGLHEPKWVTKANFGKLKVAFQPHPSMSLGGDTFIHPVMSMNPAMAMKGQTGNPMYDAAPIHHANLPPDVQGMIGPQEQYRKYPGMTPVGLHTLNLRLQQDILVHEDLLKKMEEKHGKNDSVFKSMATRKAGMDGIDWRVPRLMYCKDPKFNFTHVDQSMLATNPQAYYEVQHTRMVDRDLLEQQLGEEALARNKKLYPDCPVPIETMGPTPVTFMEQQPWYKLEDDIHERKINPYTMEQVMRGDMQRPMPKAKLFPEDHDNYKAGKYVDSDSCPIA